MRLEQQLQRLEELGLNLEEGVTVDDLLASFDRRDYEEKPFNLLLFVLGIDLERPPWGRPICSRVWNFDLECISSAEDYVRIVNRLCQVAGDLQILEGVQVVEDSENGTAWLTYRVGDFERKLKIEVEHDWADTKVIAQVMRDLEMGDDRFYAKDNGQAMVLYYLDPETVDELNKLSGGALQPA
jgi:hypothetical protein